MRIGMVGPFGLHPKSTMRSRALGLAKPLVARGHEVALFLPPWHTPADADQQRHEDGVLIRLVPLRGGVLGITRQLVRDLLAWQPDVVHCFKPKAYSGLVAWWLWQFHRHRLRLVTDSDDWEGWGGWNEREPYSWLQKRFFAWQERWGMAHCHCLTVASRTLESLAWGQGIDPTQVRYLPNGPGISDTGSETTAVMWRQRLGLGKRPLLLLYSRLFEFDTGRLVQILQGVKTAVPEVALLTVGTSLFAGEGSTFQAQLAAANLTGQVVDVGWRTLEELPGLLKTADVGIYLMDDTLLNRAKCPVKLADMLAVGLPVVGEAVGQVPEYVRHQENGRLRASGDIGGLTADLIQLLQQPTLRRQMGSAAQTQIQRHFSWHKLATIAEHAYTTKPPPPSST